MWWNLLQWKWSPLLTLISKYLPGTGRLCLPHLSAQWHLCQHLLPHHGYWLPRNTIRLHRDEGWQITGLTTHGKILWKRKQCPRFHADHTKPLVDQVREGSTSIAMQYYNLFLPSQILLQLLYKWNGIPAWIWINKYVPMELWQWSMWRQFHDPIGHLYLTILPWQLP